MLTGRRYTLTRATLALHVSEDGKRSAIQMPQGAILKVVSGPMVNGGPTGNNGVVDVLFDGKVVSMFLVDLEARGEEIITGKSAHN